MITEFAIATEICSSVLTTHLESGENFDGAVSIGFYPQNPCEVCIEHQEHRMNIQCVDIDAFCRQLRRARQLAIEQDLS